MVNTIELRHDLKGLVTKAREILDAAEKEGRELDQEELSKYERIEADIEKMEARILREEEQQARERKLESMIQDKPDESPGADKRKSETAEAFEAYVKTGDMRALQMDLSASGGYLVPPEQFVEDYIDLKRNETFMRRLSRVERVMGAESLGVPVLDNDLADLTWTTEIATRAQDSTMSFGKRSLTPHPVAKLLKVSEPLLRRTMGRAERIVRDNFAKVFAYTEETAFLQGSGSQQPLGVFTASNDGISTSRDVSTGNTTATPTLDGLIEAKWSIRGAYWPNLAWIFHRSILKLIRKLKDGEGRYLIQPSVERGNMVMTLLESPVYMSEYAPSTVSASAYVGIIGDFSYYWVVDSAAFMLKRLDELYAATNQVGFIALAETDGMPVLEEAFARVKLAAS